MTNFSHSLIKYSWLISMRKTQVTSTILFVISKTLKFSAVLIPSCPRKCKLWSINSPLQVKTNPWVSLKKTKCKKTKARLKMYRVWKLHKNSKRQSILRTWTTKSTQNYSGLLRKETTGILLSPADIYNIMIFLMNTCPKLHYK